MTISPTRSEIASHGIDTVYCLVLQGVERLEYLLPPGNPGEITSRDEGRAAIWISEFGAELHRHWANQLTGLTFEVVRRPTVISAPDYVRMSDGRTLPVTIDELAAHAAAQTFAEDDDPIEWHYPDLEVTGIATTYRRSR